MASTASEVPRRAGSTPARHPKPSSTGTTPLLGTGVHPPSRSRFTSATTSPSSRRSCGPQSARDEGFRSSPGTLGIKGAASIVNGQKIVVNPLVVLGGRLIGNC